MMPGIGNLLSNALFSSISQFSSEGPWQIVEVDELLGRGEGLLPREGRRWKQSDISFSPILCECRADLLAILEENVKAMSRLLLDPLGRDW